MLKITHFSAKKHTGTQFLILLYENLYLLLAITFTSINSSDLRVKKSSTSFMDNIVNSLQKQARQETAFVWLECKELFKCKTIQCVTV